MSEVKDRNAVPKRVMPKALGLFQTALGLCGLAAMAYGVYAMFQVWGGGVTNFPFVGELRYPNQATSAIEWIINLFTVAYAGVIYGLLFPIPFAVIAILIESFEKEPTA